MQIRLLAGDTAMKAVKITKTGEICRCEPSLFQALLDLLESLGLEFVEVAS
jgi:hypothetical protein